MAPADIPPRPESALRRYLDLNIDDGSKVIPDMPLTQKNLNILIAVWENGIMYAETQVLASRKRIHLTPESNQFIGIRIPIHPDTYYNTKVKSPILILPGLSSSGPEHWQTLWEHENPDYTRVEQDDWFDPNPQNWISKIETYVSKCDSPPILIAHSLATIAIAHWAATTRLTIRGSFLVAPADVETAGPHFELLKAFSPIPKKPLPFPSIVVASSNDPYCTLERVADIAKNWGAQMVIAGALGHINALSNIGNWPQGNQIFQDWISTLP